MFSSKSSRPTTTSDASIPGPGTYSISPGVIGGVLFSKAPKGIPLSQDPHRPVLVGSNEIPPVGSYKIKEDFEKDDKFKFKFMTGEINTKNAPFNTSERREVQSLPKDDVPGPGEYSVSKQVEFKESLPFGSIAERFIKEKIPDYPGPGSYDTQIHINDRAAPFFSSKVTRFANISQKTPEPYVCHQQWNKKETRAHDARHVNQNLSFDSSVPRFSKKKKEKIALGPGYYYNDRPSSVASIALSRTERFKGFGSYRPSTGTDQHMGPGYYNPPVFAKRKSFNMSKELNNEKHWQM